MLLCYCRLVTKSYLAFLRDAIDCNLLGFSVHGICQARILDWVAISFSRGSSQPRDWTHVSCLASGFFTTEPHGKPLSKWLVLLRKEDYFYYKCDLTMTKRIRKSFPLIYHLVKTSKHMFTHLVCTFLCLICTLSNLFTTLEQGLWASTIQLLTQD